VEHTRGSTSSLVDHHPDRPEAAAQGIGGYHSTVSGSEERVASSANAAIGGGACVLLLHLSAPPPFSYSPETASSLPSYCP
jgi:hypothetical protein